MTEIDVIPAQFHGFVFEGVTIRAFDIEGNRFIVGADLCKALGVSNIRNTMSRLDSEDKITLRRSDTVDTTDGIWEHFAPKVQSVVLLTESGAKSLIERTAHCNDALPEVQGWFSAASPFDSIRRVRDDGTEFWSARELMPLLGYGADWRNFAASIERARATCVNSGDNDSGHFVAVTEKTGGRPREDHHLTRYAAYLVAMNGDPRKSEVAAAQHYFAVKTREAEVAPEATLTDDEIVHRALAITAARVRTLTAKVAELEPKGEAYDEFIASRAALSMKLAGEYLGWGQNQLLRRLREEKILRSGGVSHNLPYAQYDRLFHVIPVTIPISDGKVLHTAKTLIWSSSLPWVRSRVGLGPRKRKPLPSAIPG